MTRHLKVGLIAAGVVYGLTLVIFLQLPSRLFGDKGTEVRVEFRQIADLVKGDPVRVDGVAAGKVRKIELADRGRAAVVTIGVFDDAMPVYADARAAIRWRTVLGGNEYVDLRRGTKAAGALKGAIPLARTETQVELDDITTAMDGDAGTGLQSVFRELGIALGEPSAVRKVVSTLAQEAPTVARGVGALRGEQRGDLRALVSSTSAAVRAMDGADEPVRRILQNAGQTLVVTARRASRIDSTLRRSPQTLGDIDTTLLAADRTLTKADPLVDKLTGPANDVAPTLRRARPLLREADDLLADLRPLLGTLRPAVRKLAAASGKAVPLVDDLTPSITRIDEEILPHLAERDPITRRAGYEMIGPTLSAAMDATGLYDSTGRYLRFPALSNNNPIDLSPCRVMVSDPEVDQVAFCEGAFSVLNDVLRNPLP